MKFKIMREYYLWLFACALMVAAVYCGEYTVADENKKTPLIPGYPITEPAEKLILPPPEMGANVRPKSPNAININPIEWLPGIGTKIYDNQVVEAYPKAMFISFPLNNIAAGLQSFVAHNPLAANPWIIPDDYIFYLKSINISVDFCYGTNNVTQYLLRYMLLAARRPLYLDIINLSGRLQQGPPTNFTGQPFHWEKTQPVDLWIPQGFNLTMFVYLITNHDGAGAPNLPDHFMSVLAHGYLIRAPFQIDRGLDEYPVNVPGDFTSIQDTYILMPR